MSPKIKTKEQASKITQTAPTPSESTKTFEKRVVTDYFYSPTKSNMSSRKRIEDLDLFLEKIMPLEEQDNKTKA